MNERSELSATSLLEALANFRTSLEGADVSEETAGLIAFGLILTVFPGAELLKQIIESSFPRVSRPAAYDDAALNKMAELVANGRGLRPASREVAWLAEPGASDEATAQRLRRKFRSDPDGYLESFQSKWGMNQQSRRLILGLLKRKRRQLGRLRAEVEKKIEDGRSAISSQG